MDILVLNVNTTVAVTDEIVQVARQAAGPGTTVTGLTPRFGAPSVEGNVESYLAAGAVLEAVNGYRGPYDGIVLAGFGEHGVEGLRELVEVPVVDITEAAAMVASLLGRSFSVVTTLDRTVPLIEDRLTLMGLRGRCASVRASGLAVLEVETDPEAARQVIVAEALRAVREDRAEVICLGCGAMAGLTAAVEAATGVPAVDGVTAAVKLVESLHQLGLRTSKIRTYARPLAKAVVWPGAAEVPA